MNCIFPLQNVFVSKCQMYSSLMAKCVLSQNAKYTQLKMQLWRPAWIVFFHWICSIHHPTSPSSRNYHYIKMSEQMHYPRHCIKLNHHCSYFSCCIKLNHHNLYITATAVRMIRTALIRMKTCALPSADSYDFDALIFRQQWMLNWDQHQRAFQCVKKVE